MNLEDDDVIMNLEDEDVTVNLEEEDVTVNLEDEDVTMKDAFLNLLCFDNDDEDEIERNSVEDWSESEKDYEKDVEDDEDYEDEGVVYPCYNPSIDWKSVKPIVTMKFESPAQLKDMLIDYGVANGYQLVFTVNDNNRLLVRCGIEETNVDETGKKTKVWKCPFRLWASRVPNDDSFQIKTLNDQHACSRQFYLGSLLTYSWIAKRFFKEIIRNPEIPLRQLQQDVMRKYQCRVSIGQCSRAKKKVLYDFDGGLKEHYARLSDYKAEILETNPGSTVKMAVDTMPNGDIYFSSFYICFKAVKDGWIDGCRKVICLDGCFLKISGQLLSAVGRDANNNIFPLAWAVVSVENKENWSWFLNLLRGDIDMEDGVGLTFISDQHKGIIEAVKDIFPNAEHRQCTRHIYANFKKKYRGLQFKSLFWAAANSTTKQFFEEKMEELKTISKSAYDHLMERNPTTWSRAFFEVGRACDVFENGMSESFNSSIRVARRKPIISMFEEIRTFVMRRMFSMSKKSKSYQNEVCPRIRKKIEVIKKLQRHYDVIGGGSNIFEVRSEKNAYAVNIQEQSCTCGSWQLSGIPCRHTVAALVFINKEPDAYVSNWFKKDKFKDAYKHGITPLKGSIHWPKTDDIKPLPPKEKRMPGRPKVKRNRDPSEKEKKNKKVKSGRKMTCQNCQESGHNKRSCNNEKRDPQPKEVKQKGEL
ncbi:hypothetical protein QVD17_05241 [Tagetes erecta]|uniref:SWIM-type domain-containing protein n=1 Tax=Tagetes erecta TaxID=13708 RepID=A0AAD8LE15_TARER|nr:hypothetical protein QVD17_05241 [Tagetes erecta]